MVSYQLVGRPLASTSCSNQCGVPPACNSRPFTTDFVHQATSLEVTLTAMVRAQSLRGYRELVTDLGGNPSRLLGKAGITRGA